MATIPKLLNLNAPTIRNQKTLIWLQNQDTINWSKWDAVVHSISAYHHWSKYANIIGLIITDTKDIDMLQINVPFILISQKVLSLQSEEYWQTFDNLLNLDYLDQYPFIHEWDGSIADAVSILALLCRYNRVVDCVISPARSANLSVYPITFSYNIKPNETWVFSQFFKHKDKNRHLEIKECLTRNCACPDIDKIVLINEKDYSSEFNMPGSKKIKQIVNKKRLTYTDFLMYVYYSVPKNVFTILCNADIYFEDLSDLHKINMTNRMLGLLRWDVDTNGDAKIFGPRADSQDSWIFLSDSIKSKKWDFTKFNFQLGQAGCDNAFAGHILRTNFVLCNPSVSLKTYHLHNTNIRNYDKKDYIRSDVYINLAPTFIIDTKQETKPDTKPYMLSNENVSFQIKSSAISDEITYCTMLEKEGRFIWEPCVENNYFDMIPIYTWKNACVTPNGLVYDPYTIYKGDDNYWENANIDILTPLQKCDKIFAIPFKNTDVFKNYDAYLLYYISRCARLLTIYPDTSVIVPIQFNIDFLHLKTVPFDNTAYWANEVIGMFPGHELGMEDIDALRSMYPWIKVPTPQKICAIFSECNAISAFVTTKLPDYVIRIVDSYEDLFGASICIVMDNWEKLWALPKGCHVIEFQQELKINGECQHLAHISGFTSCVLFLSKGSDIQEQMIEQLECWFNSNP